MGSAHGVRRDGKDMVLRIPMRATYREMIHECERQILKQALITTRGSIVAVVRGLKIPRQSFYNRLKALGIKMPRARHFSEIDPASDSRSILPVGER